MISSIETYFQSLFSGNSFFAETFFANTVAAWFGALVVFVLLLVVFKGFQALFIWRIKKLSESTKTDIDDTFVQIIQTLRPPFYSFIAFYLALRTLEVLPLVQRIVDIVLIVWIVWQAIMAVQILLNFIFKKGMGTMEDPSTKSATKALNKIATAILWALGGLFILSNLGVDVTSLVAGLGIGGLALALALQNILGDLFSSFAIYFDKPFKIGDFIVVGAESGVVEHIGIKTTRLRALQGEEIIISNRELTSARIQNFKKLRERRVAFSLGVLYDTPNEKLKSIPVIIKSVVESIEGTRFGRAHFASFGDSALLFDVAYFILSSNYEVYKEKHQEVNLLIKEKFEKEGIEMAYPTQTIYLQKPKA